MFRMQGGPTDAAVVAQVVSGDRELYSLLVQRHTRSIIGLAFRVTGNDADADEVVQDFSDTRLDSEEVVVREGSALPLLCEDGVDGFLSVER